eukprot:scaffold23233_cov111-Isochrysis_galbana.AAC.6
MRHDVQHRGNGCERGCDGREELELGLDCDVSGEMGNEGAMRMSMSRADSALLARAGEDLLGIGIGGIMGLQRGILTA